MDHSACEISCDLVGKSKESENNDMLLFGPKVLLFLTALIIPSDWTPLGVSGQETTTEPLTDAPSLLVGPSAGQTAPVTIETFTEDPKCRDEKFACTRLYSVHRPIKQCVHQSCFTSVRRMYIINNEICSRLVCKEHEAMKDELCRQMAGLPPRRLRRSNYFRLPPCENVNLQRPNGV
ncbi:microfibrillar-associated protein 5 isoform X5 [Pipistrellus kuhlii]|uniref:microfibrillar-associated protein 5 isoform X5 n=1 Tax=Pipistrellus kuhlii TaxID=59472 RepID=UPI001E26EC59|nr:microfibrillar-associated protein 5 isoform X5 [Pipistrellus kuhlii]